MSRGVCSNCAQWLDAVSRDCFNECAARGFAIRPARVGPEVVRLLGFGCLAWIDGVALYTCSETTIGRVLDDRAQWVEVTAPGSQAFLDEVNVSLGTSFELNQFAGR